MSSIAKNKTLNILGLGTSGVAAAELALSKGFFVNAIDQSNSDQFQEFMQNIRGNKQIEFFPEYSADILPDADETIISPGIKPHSLLGQAALNSNTNIISELEFASQFLTLPYCAITGTNGKTTTTEMTGQITKNAGLRTLLAGNIGLPASKAVMLQDYYDIIIFEVSSFQLEYIKNFKPLSAVILNIQSDHIDWHGSFLAYKNAKFKIFTNSSSSTNIINYNLFNDYCTLNSNLNCNPITFSNENSNADITFNVDNMQIQSKLLYESLSLIKDSWQKHNIENLLAAIALSSFFVKERKKLNESVCKVINNFTSAPHRQEIITTYNNILFVNDSKSTNPAALISAVLAFSKKDHDICLIAGGLDKKMDFSSIINIKNKIKFVFLVGDSKKALVSLWNYDIHCILCNTFEEAVLKAAGHATKGDIVLLSPACASMDMFKNYKERGETFRSIVLNNIMKK
jgi:UDP-N-acetylmuramoylalanine--D-glutamate ligase